MRIVGIDLGSMSIKAVEFETVFGGRYEVHEYHEVKLTEGQDAFEAAAALIARLPKQPERIAVSLRTLRTTLRNLNLPTKDRKAIQASVRFELEDELPFEIDDAAFDFSTLSTAGQTSHVHVAATLKKHVEIHLGQWAATGAEPDVVTTESWAYRTLINRLPQITTPADVTTPDASMLLDIGYGRTLVYLHHQGIPVFAREIQVGGQDLTFAISQRYGVSLPQAELAKLDNGFVLAPSQQKQATTEQREFSDTLLVPLQPLLKDIRQACLTCKNLTEANVGKIYLTGGTSMLPGLARLIEEDLQIPVVHLQPLTTLNPGVPYSEHTEAHFSLAAGLALCLVGPERNQAINFRKGPLAKKGRARELNLTTLRRPMIAAAVIAGCFLTSLVAQNFVYEDKMTKLNSQLDKSLRAFFPDASNSAIRGYLADTRRLRKELNANLTKRKEVARLKGSDEKSPLTFLKNLSSHIPKNVVVDMIRYEVGASGTKPYGEAEPVESNLSFVVANPQVAEKLASLIEQKLDHLERSKTEEVAEADGTKRWKITFKGTPK